MRARWKVRELGCVFVLLAGLAQACRAESSRDEAVAVAEAAATALSQSDVTVRELVARSTEVASLAARSDGPEAAMWTKLAADLRLRAFRIDHAEAHARDALALYALAAQMSGSHACEAARRHAELAAEVQGDPAVFVREAAAAVKTFEGMPCADDLARHLRQLEAFRPGAVTPSQDDDPEPAPPSPRAWAAASEPLGPRVLEAIDPYGAQDRARIVVTLSGATAFQQSASSRGIVIELENVEAPAREIEVGGIVERVRVAPAGVRARLEIQLAKEASHRIFSLPEPYRLIVDVATETPESARLEPPAGAPRPVRRVAIDPGHGGHDPGAIGPTGLREKDVTLDIAHRVAPILARELGVLTLLTRDDDRYVALAERTARANAFHADLFISIHCNASESPSARGIATFVFDTTRDDSVAKIAARENATSLEASLNLGSDASQFGLAQLGARSRHLAKLLERTTMASLSPRWPDTSSYGVKAAGFFVLVGAEMPAVLFETSFISNPTEEQRLRSAEYRQRLADAIVNAVRAYREGR